MQNLLGTNPIFLIPLCLVYCADEQKTFIGYLKIFLWYPSSTGKVFISSASDSNRKLFPTGS